MTRISKRFSDLGSQGRGGLVTFVTAGDPDYSTSLTLVRSLSRAGADLIELGMPFSDPMADGPAIQESNQRALTAGMTLKKTLQLVREFREQDDNTPVLLMGYYNPIYQYGGEKFLRDASQCGVDGLIIVDLPPEEDRELCLPARNAGIDWIRLSTPTTDDRRLPRVLRHGSGFLYYVSIAGVTGTKSASYGEARMAVQRIKQQTELPVAVGFGVKTPEDVHEITRFANAAVVGSAIVQCIKDNLDDSGAATPDLVDRVCTFVERLASGVA